MLFSRGLQVPTSTKLRVLHRRTRNNYSEWIGLYVTINEVPLCFSIRSCWKTGERRSCCFVLGFLYLLQLDIPMSAMLDGNSNWATLDNGDTGPSISNKREAQCDGKSLGGEQGWSGALFSLPSIQSTYILFCIHLPSAYQGLYSTSPLFWMGYRPLGTYCTLQYYGFV